MKSMNVFGKGVLDGFKETEFVSQATKFPNRNLVWKLAEKFHRYNQEKFPKIEDFVQVLHDAEWKETIQENSKYYDKDCVVTLYTAYNFKSPKQYYTIGEADGVKYIPSVTGREKIIRALCKPEEVKLEEHICFSVVSFPNEIDKTVVGIAECALVKDCVTFIKLKEDKDKLTHAMNIIYKGWK